MLDSLDDERSKARFRESVYISVIIWLFIAWFIFYGPQVIFHQPRLINPADVLKRDKNSPTSTCRRTPRSRSTEKPTNVHSDKDRVQQTTKPTLDKKTLEQLQAMRKAGTPAPPRGTHPPAPQHPRRSRASNSRQPPHARNTPRNNRQWSMPPARSHPAQLRHPRPSRRRRDPSGRPGSRANRGNGGDYGQGSPSRTRG